MTAVAEQTRIEVRLQGACAAASCLQMAWDVHRQLSRGGYGHRASGLVLGDHTEYLATHRTARKRAQHARNLGYRFATIDRQEHAEDVYAINTSTPERQGRRMSDGYWQRPVFGPNPVLCERHHVYTYGVLRDDRLDAYLWLYRVGDLAMVSSILGHAYRLRDDIMWLLATETLREQAEIGGVAFYNLHASGTDGLRYFKERLGFRPMEIQWTL